jgi:predicted DNA-binding ribbon-helix-helix protein
MSAPGEPGDGGILRKRSVTIAGHRTSLSLEAAFWDALKEIAATRGLSLNRLIEDIDRARQESNSPTPPNLSSAVRVFVLRACRRAAP